MAVDFALVPSGSKADIVMHVRSGIIAGHEPTRKVLRGPPVMVRALGNATLMYSRRADGVRP